MPKTAFLAKDFLLLNKYAEELYFDYAEDLPIVDYHCHLSPDQVAEDKQFRNLFEVWLAGDHYKWRAMRSNGVSERFCTGDASDREKFQAWAQTVPYTLRNPLYHWTHLELRKPFGITDRVLDGNTAQGIWDECNELLDGKDFTAQGLMRQWQVEVVCTTDDPVDGLEHHRKHRKSGSRIQMRPTWRPDKGMAVDVPADFNAWLDKLAQVADVEIKDLATYLEALQRRHDAFHELGCRLSDHGLETVYAEPCTEKEAKAIFAKVRKGTAPSAHEADQFKSFMLLHWGRMDHAKGWVQQFHIGAIRNNNARMRRTLGPDTGFDSIGDANYAKPLSKFLSDLDADDQLAPTILYNLNPRDNEMIATMIGNFQDGSRPGKIQFGSAWWFLDQKDGMERQIDALSSLGLLSRFVGMLTDSRSFLSYSRHEYFRRILCQKLGQDIKDGLLPKDMQLIGKLVADVCYHNAAGFFDFGLGQQKKTAAKR